MATRFGACTRLAVFCGVVVPLIAIGAETASAYTETTLHAFCSVPKHCADGSEPSGELVADQEGNLYGTTGLRGAYGGGTVFEYEVGTGTFETIYNFCEKTGCSDGKAPYRVKLVIDTTGSLYGTTVGGGDNSDSGAGVVFELVRGTSGWREKVLYKFCSKHDCTDGDAPDDGLTYSGAATGQPYDGTSPLFGTTSAGGASNRGTVFAISPERKHKWTEAVLYSFCPSTGCTDGEGPDTPLYVDGGGNIYGTTYSGGQVASAGVVFELIPGIAGYTEAVLYSFCSQASCVDGDDPWGGVVMDGSGNLFGTTSTGGSADLGVVFELSPSGSQWNYNVLADFNGSNGSSPRGAVIFGSDGNLYGTTYFGGAKDDGTVFMFNGAIQSLYSFCNGNHCPDGTEPLAGVIQDSSGNLFGTAQRGGPKNGTLYELSP